VTQAERDKLFADAVQAALRKMRSAKPARNKREKDSRCHSNDERRYIVHFDELLSAFLELEARLL